MLVRYNKAARQREDANLDGERRARIVASLGEIDFLLFRREEIAGIELTIMAT